MIDRERDRDRDRERERERERELERDDVFSVCVFLSGERLYHIMCYIMIISSASKRKRESNDYCCCFAAILLWNGSVSFSYSLFLHTTVEEVEHSDYFCADIGLHVSQLSVVLFNEYCFFYFWL